VKNNSKDMRNEILFPKRNRDRDEFMLLINLAPNGLG